jgi:hypothetical protein
MELTWIAILASLSMALAGAVGGGIGMLGRLAGLASGAGTAVALLSVGAASSFVRFPRWSHRLAAVFMMLAGALLSRTGLLACPTLMGSLLK